MYHRSVTLLFKYHFCQIEVELVVIAQLTLFISYSRVLLHCADDVY